MIALNVEHVKKKSKIRPILTFRPVVFPRVENHNFDNLLETSELFRTSSYRKKSKDLSTCPFSRVTTTKSSD